MKRYRGGAARGFSLVELLAVVLILAVLAGVAIPLYINTRNAAAARACKANEAAIAAALSAYALRNGQYPTNTNVMTAYNSANLPNTGLIGAPEGLNQAVTCPLDGSAYTITGGGSGNSITITCPNASKHVNVLTGTTADYSKTLSAPSSDSIP
jgi:type IV pilus assembly protein PilA